MSLTYDQRSRHAAELIAAAERHLGPLTDGQRRDLVADRTDWSTEAVADAVADYGIWRPMREDERQALAAFAKDYGREWKQYLCAAWLSYSYKGLHMGGKDTGTLRGIRNQRGHAWLDRVRPADLREPAPAIA